MITVEEKLEQADKQCQLNGGRLTLKRKQILLLLLQAEKAISAYELIEIYQQKYNKVIAPMSAYRALSYLESEHLAHKITSVNKFVACTQIGDSSEHGLSQLVFCQQCQSATEHPLNPTINIELTNKLQQTGYQLQSKLIELTCICKACLENEKPNNKQLSHTTPLS